MRKLFILLFILLLPSLAQSQEPSPSAFLTSKNEQEHSSYTANKTNTYNRGSQQNPIFIKELPSEPTASERDAEAKEREQKASNERRTVNSTIVVAIFTAVLAIITGFLAKYTFKLWHATVDLSKDAKETADRQAKEMEDSLYIANRSASALERTVRTMKENANQELRAYVFPIIDKDTMSRDSFDRLFWYKNVTFITKNFGKTPAYDVASSLWICLGKYPLNFNFVHAYQLSESHRSPIAPGEFSWQYTGLPDNLTQAEITAITERRSAIYVGIKVEYFDAFEKKHTTTLCLCSTGSAFSEGLLAYYHEGGEPDQR
jgi:hypothetical protein